MKIHFLGQGYRPTTKNSVGDKLVELLSQEAFDSLTCFTAFSSVGGVSWFKENIIDKYPNLKTTIITGVAQKGTSKEALEGLLNLKAKSFIFHFPSTRIFHPKIYLLESLRSSVVIVGSSNLTTNGLLANVESSLLIKVNNATPDELDVISQLKDYYSGIFDLSDPNLRLLTQKLIDYLVSVDLVPTEKERRKIQSEARSNKDDMIDASIFPKRQAIFSNRSKKGNPIGSTYAARTVRQFNVVGGLTYLWESGPLTERDLNIPKGSSTNPTGSMLFKKGRLDDIDQRHYFRDIVFSSLKWYRYLKSKTPHLERAVAIFRIVIDGKDHGEFELTITHNTRTDTKSYAQKNSMTSISWGAAKKIIANDRHIGKNATLFKNKRQSNRFTLVIA